MTIMKLVAAVVIFSTAVFSETPTITVIQENYGAVDFGEVHKGSQFYSEVSHVWQNHGYLGYSARASIGDRARAAVGGESHMYNSYPVVPKYPSTMEMGFTFFLNQIEGSYLLGDPKTVSLLVHAGYFPFKYNQDVRDMGEYLFRTGTYPPYIINFFDYPLIRLLGFHLHNSLWGIVEQDLIINSETQMVPLGDGSLTYLVAVKARKLFEIGGGIQFARLFPVDKKLTQGKHDAGNKYIDTVTSDTGYYTFQGTKLMARAVFDPKELFKSTWLYNYLGANDLRLYSEVAVLGLEEYPVYYEHWRDRVPRMVGFNLPAFKFLDVAAIELQFNPNPFPNNFKHQYEDIWPLGLNKDDLGWVQTMANKLTKWRWAFYIKRTFLGTFDFIALVGRNNYRIVTLEKGDKSYYDKGESLIAGDHWQWKLKIGYHFSK